MSIITPLLRKRPNSKELVMESYRCSNYSKCVRLFSDVNRDNKMWALVRGRRGHWNLSYLEIHLHSVKNIEGTGWDHGKGGKGTTQVIE